MEAKLNIFILSYITNSLMKKDLDIVSLNKKAWNNVAKKYAQAKYSKINPLTELFCKKLPENAFILDLGSGTGLPFAKYFVDKGFKVLGIDISTEMIKISKINVPNAEFRELSMIELDFVNKFDGIFSNYSMLLLNPTLFKDAAKKIVKSLKINGLLYLALNEPREKNANLDNDVVVKILGEEMYSRAYIEEEILTILTPLGLNLLKIHREIISSKEFGIEHCMRLLFKKKLLNK